jgi:hypothetical protein
MNVLMSKYLYIASKRLKPGGGAVGPGISCGRSAAWRVRNNTFPLIFRFRESYGTELALGNCLLPYPGGLYKTN